MPQTSAADSAANRAANKDQREYWTGEGAEYWQRCGDWWEEMFAPFGQAMFDAADPQPGERVLDVGCGAGTTTLEAAERVAPNGAVVGVDISPQLRSSGSRWP